MKSGAPTIAPALTVDHERHKRGIVIGGRERGRGGEYAGFDPTPREVVVKVNLQEDQKVLLKDDRLVGENWAKLGGFDRQGAPYFFINKSHEGADEKGRALLVVRPFDPSPPSVRGGRNLSRTSGRVAPLEGAKVLVEAAHFARTPRAGAWCQEMLLLLEEGGQVAIRTNGGQGFIATNHGGEISIDKMEFTQVTDTWGPMT